MTVYKDRVAVLAKRTAIKRAKVTSNTITCMTSVSTIVMACYLTDRHARKDDFTTKCIVVTAIFENFVGGMIPVAVDKINKMAEFGSPRLEENEVHFAGFLQQ